MFDRPIEQRLAIGLSGLSLVIAAAIAVLQAAGGWIAFTLERNQPVRALLPFLPVAFAVLGVWSALCASRSGTWVSAVLLAAFAVIGGFSLGRMHVWSALAMILAAVALLGEFRPGTP